MKKLTLNDVDVAGKRVLMRVDFNVPLNEQQHITDSTRIEASLPTIRTLLEKGASVILMSHLGRPKGKRIPALSLAPVAESLSQLIGRPVKFASDCIGPEVRQLARNLQPGEVMLLENLRFHPEEVANDSAFAAQLAALGDLYVNDAFGTAHRAHASTAGISAHLTPCVAGLLMEKELDYLGQAIGHAKRPYTAIIGGAKISGKIDVIQNLITKVDHLLIGGGMMFTFLKAKGYDIGTSLLEEDKLDLAKEILDSAAASGKTLHLPADTAVADAFENDAASSIVPVESIPSEMMGLDIGPATIRAYTDIIVSSETVFWNGPMGVFEMPNFAKGTNAIAQALADATKRGCITVVGGGDSAAAIAQANLDDQVSHVSTGGGASLEFIEGKALPGVEALTGK